MHKSKRLLKGYCFKISDFLPPFFSIACHQRNIRFSEDFYCEMPKKFSKFHVPGTEMKFIADEKLISTVFRHVMFCVTQVVTS